MDINWLQDFLALAETENFSRAAVRRNLSQAAFSRRIQSLENWLGSELVDRKTVPVHLTMEGRLFRQEASETVAKLFDAKSSISGQTTSGSANISIAMPHVIATSRFTKWWSEWSKDTGVRAITHIGNVTDVMSEFLAGSSDILICHRSDQLPVMLDPRHFISKRVERDQLRAFVAMGSTLPNRLANSSRDETIPLVMYRKGAYFARLVDALIEQSAANIRGIGVIQSEMSQVIRECIAMDMGIGWLPDCVVREPAMHGVEPVDMPGLAIPLEIVAFTHRRRRTAATDTIWGNI